MHFEVLCDVELMLYLFQKCFLVNKKHLLIVTLLEFNHGGGNFLDTLRLEYSVVAVFLVKETETTLRTRTMYKKRFANEDRGPT